MGLEKTFKKIGAFTKDQLVRREARMQSPAFKAKMRKIEKGCENDLKNISINAINAGLHFVRVFVKSTAESFKTHEKIKRKNKYRHKNKQDSGVSEILGNGIGVGLVELVKGSADVIRLCGNLALLTGRTAILGTRYLIGK